MSYKSWPKGTITADNGETQTAIAPLIISASRSTDIPAFYGQWFLNRLNAGYVKWINPWSGKSTYVSFENTRVIVFWTKNPAPLIPLLHEIDKRKINYYFQFTVNDYETEKLEPGIPPLDERLETFARLSDMIGPARVLWRFDPLLLTDALGPEELGMRICRIGKTLGRKTGRCTISFIACYKKVASNLARSGIRMRIWDAESRSVVLKAIAGMSRESGISCVSCADENDRSVVGILPGRCIDGNLIIREFGHDEKVSDFFGYVRTYPSAVDHQEDSIGKDFKDRGQRRACGCCVSKDIGSYNTCGHQCVYCYANSSPERAFGNCRKVSNSAGSILSVK